MKGDFDWSQITFLIMIVVVGFVRWLGSRIQESRGGGAAQSEEDPNEEALREAAWRRQTGQAGAPPPPQGGDKAFDPWSELRELFKPETPPPLATPPPIPQTTRAPAPPARQPTSMVRTRQVPSASEYRPNQAPARTRVAEVETAYMTRIPQVDTVIGENSAHAPSTDALAVDAAQMKALQQLLQNPNSIRQAILLREILGPPKALQSDSPAFI
ncbi:MAG: hypothetical protein KDK97_14865 [Verrucomicrobiales bacterium]|nr:hypothetical protein [Verrucomicrobiales bacterium]MCP5558511.1 hypothetical protein [Verrucomicrobiaceae bacterium]